MTLLSLATAALSWWRFSYADGPASVVVTRGLLSRSVRTVPNDRIRGVEVETPVLHRLFGLVRVRIDAAAGTMTGKDEELVVDGVPRAEGDRLRTAVLTHRAGPAPDGAAEPEPAEEEFGRFDNRWLLYAPLVGSYLALPLAAVGALFRLAQELPENLRPELDEPALSGLQVLLFVVGGALFVLLGRIGGGRRGRELGLPAGAPRGVAGRRPRADHPAAHRAGDRPDPRRHVAEGAGMRLVGAARVNALVTGLGDAARRGQLLPLGPRAEAWTLARRLVDDPGPLVPHPAGGPAAADRARGPRRPGRHRGGA